MAIGAVLLLAVLVAIVWPGEKEPEYQGKKLSYWLEITTHEEYVEAREAVRQIGTNALPLLLKWIRYSPWYEKKAVTTVLKQLPPGARHSAIVEQLLGPD